MDAERYFLQDESAVDGDCGLSHYLKTVCDRKQFFSLNSVTDERKMVSLLAVN